MPDCRMCNEPIEEHTLEEAQTCYYKSKLPRVYEEVE